MNEETQTPRPRRSARLIPVQEPTTKQAKGASIRREVYDLLRRSSDYGHLPRAELRRLSRDKAFVAAHLAALAAKGEG